ncbi:hypothetical protein [Oceanospirillum maris]|uniref:hypothetical protein n=1 Tax=Oceanospirillum maris TaxID=64977 RepID=UPI000402C769|nr:hypothetical protein [Oceanospirillum maris]
MSNLYTNKDTREQVYLIRSGIVVTGSDIKLVEYAPASDPANKQLMLADQWQQQMYQPLHKLECPACTGTAKDPARPVKPCPTCFGSGWVNHSGEPLANCRETAIALAEIHRQFRQLRGIVNRSDVQQLLKDAQDDAIARQEREWRNGQGCGPEGKRHTAD